MFLLKFLRFQELCLGVSKLNPPIGGDVEAVTIEMEEYRN
jgi:dihydroneopterin aldolase